MNTVGDSIRLIMPTGTRGGNAWDEYPEWPPDLFGIGAYLLEQSGAYAWLRPKGEANFFSLDEATRRRLRETGKEWRRGDWLKDGRGDRKRVSSKELLVKQLWQFLWSQRDGRVVVGLTPQVLPEWATVALFLLIIADEASAGLGFFPEKDAKTGVPPYVPVAALNNFFFPTGRRKISRAPPRHPFTMAWYLDPAILCILPKTRTSSVGCTIRSFSHHLAMVSGIGEVRTRWHVNPVVDPTPDVFNLLLIPFPYRMRGKSFRASKKFASWGLFDVDQDWLPKTRTSVDSQEFARFALQLVAAAQEEVGTVHGIVLPELALNLTCYCALRQVLQRRLPNLRFLISGVQQHENGEKRNVVKVTAFYRGRVAGVLGDRIMEVTQSKHHRWKLDREQIRCYSLGDALDPNRNWWEDVDVHRRELNFFVFGSGSCFTTLICEDLARVDPGQKVLRAIGPNLVFALLMDGPQLRSRWPGRSCSVLAEDPGSSVLTLTSLALVERSAIAMKSSSKCVALWRDPSGSTQELDLPAGSHALCVTLTSKNETEYTLDGRDDGGAASVWRLSGSIPVKLAKAPSWV
jgi:hypothetical protein